MEKDGADSESFTEIFLLDGSKIIARNFRGSYFSRTFDLASRFLGGSGDDRQHLVSAPTGQAAVAVAAT